MHSARESERACTDRDRYLVGMRVFQFSRTFHCSSSLKISQNFARLVGQWAALRGVAELELYCVWNCVDYDQSSTQVTLQAEREGWKRANINHGMPAALFELQLEFGLALALALALSSSGFWLWLLGYGFDCGCGVSCCDFACRYQSFAFICISHKKLRYHFAAATHTHTRTTGVWQIPFLLFRIESHIGLKNKNASATTLALSVPPSLSFSLSL